MAQKSGLANPLAVDEGGTGGTNTLDARTNLDLGGLSSNTSTGILQWVFDSGGGPVPVSLDASAITASTVISIPDAGSGAIGMVITKSDTGDPAGTEGLFCINTFDQTFKVYAQAQWRTVTSW